MNLFFLCLYANSELDTDIYTGLFKKPNGYRDSLNKIFKIRMLKRWGKQVSELGDNLVVSSHAIGKKPFSFWISAFGATLFSGHLVSSLWMHCFLHFLLLPGKQLLAFGRQFIFVDRQTVKLRLLEEAGSANTCSANTTQTSSYCRNGIGYRVIWRIITYYLYLAIGVCVIPGWLKKR